MTFKPQFSGFFYVWYKYLPMRKYLVFIIYLSCFSRSSAQADTGLIKEHLLKLTQTPAYRTHINIAQLNNTAEYIKSQFETYSDSTSFQEFTVEGSTYKNVISSFGPAHAPRIIIGAHYDVCGPQEGADDNASGVTGLLELARLLQNKKLNYRIDLVAYTLEEPPHFRTENMGSFHHAKYLYDNHIEVYGMISLEMIGYFSDAKNSQDYPARFLSLIYGKTGDYITLVRKNGSGKFARKFCKAFKKHDFIKTKKFTAPASLPGIDFSDHLNYWLFDFSALMITDTSFYRNKNYHKSTDTLQTIDIDRMAAVITSVFESILNLQA